MNRTRLLVTVLVAISSLTVVAAAQDQHRKFSTALSGYNEVHFIFTPTLTALRGAVSTPAQGQFTAQIDDSGNIIHYELSYEGLTGTVAQAHIHFGQRHTVGGIVAWLCQGTVLAPESVREATPTCPQQGTVTGTIRPAQVVEPPGQGLAAGDFEALVAAIRAGTAYANVHSSTFGPGEIRGQIEHDQGQGQGN